MEDLKKKSRTQHLASQIIQSNWETYIKDPWNSCSRSMKKKREVVKNVEQWRFWWADQDIVFARVEFELSLKLGSIFVMIFAVLFFSIIWTFSSRSCFLVNLVGNVALGQTVDEEGQIILLPTPCKLRLIYWALSSDLAPGGMPRCGNAEFTLGFGGGGQPLQW